MAIAIKMATCSNLAHKNTEPPSDPLRNPLHLSLFFFFYVVSSVCLKIFSLLFTLTMAVLLSRDSIQSLYCIKSVSHFFKFILSTELQSSSSSHRVLEYFHCTFLLSDMYLSDDDSPLAHSGLFYLQCTPKCLADGLANMLLLLFVHVQCESLIGLESNWTFTVKGYGLFGITLILKRAGVSGAMAKVDFLLHLVL